jgi:predicted amidohydrolase
LIEFSARAEAEGARLLCFPEGFLQGYLTMEADAHHFALDLNAPDFAGVLEHFPKSGPVIVLGLIERAGAQLFNTAVVVEHGKLIGKYRKQFLLPGESVFTAGTGDGVFTAADLCFGINICYDTNFSAAAQGVADRGATLLVCPANNMSRRETAVALQDEHNAVRGLRCRETGLWFLSADVTGERDGRLSLGPTAVINPDGEVVAQLPLGETGLLLYDIPVA